MKAVQSFLFLTIWLFFPFLVFGNVVVENLPRAPRGWKVSGLPSNDRLIKLDIGLKQQNLDQMYDRLYEVSDPRLESYGKHYEKEDVDNMLKPSQETHDKVMTWLKNAGIERISTDGHWISFVTSVESANKLLDTTFKNYKKDGETRLRTLQYSVPDQVADAVDLITPTTYFGQTIASRVSSFGSLTGTPTTTKEDSVAPRQAAPSCSETITPDCLHELYQTTGYVPSVKSGSRIGFGSFLNSSANYDDLYKFESIFGIPKQGFQTETTHGGVNNQSASELDRGEPDLDVETIIGMAHPLPVTQYITGGLAPFMPDLVEPTVSENEPYVSYYRFLLAKPNSELPQVISNSYGEEEETVPHHFAIRTCNLIAQMGLRGITILESAGDIGVGATCETNDGTHKKTFGPQFPAGCPYVTAVGGTQSVNPEIAWLNGSGGFSNYFPRPKYQEYALDVYFKEHIKPSTLEYYQPFFNMQGRGFPDISAHSLRPDFFVIFSGNQTISGGTSASSPTWAGIVGLLNDARLRAGRPALGWLNPWLYFEGYKALHDITLGGSDGCYGYDDQTGQKLKGAPIIPYASWNATPGWDPVTGYFFSSP